MENIFLKTARWGFRGFTAAVFAVTVFLIGMGLLGIRTYAVLSGSMEPTISTGTLLFVKPVEPGKLEPYDVITFHLGENVTATHRIISIHKDADGTWFQTKGDANSTVDGKLVHESQVIGCPVLSVPRGGYLIWYLRSNFSAFIVALLGTAAMLFLLIPSNLMDNNPKMKKGKYLRQ